MDIRQLEKNYFRPVDNNGDESREFVSCGEILDGFSVAIVNPSTLHPGGDGEIGEIWVQGPSVAKGYWKNPDATKAAFKTV